MFLKYARVEVLAASDSNFEVGGNTTKMAASHYSSLGFESLLDIQGILSEVAEAYKVSDDPKDYYFVAVRACTADIPNENGDAFSKKELLRFDHHLAKRVYQTFTGKPIHVNHRADNPKMARGVIFDTHYNDGKTLSQESREAYKTEYGVDLEKDGFVEVLVGLDKTKDPHLAEGIRKGSLDSFSMGCECERTVCNICANVAKTKLEFCKHIRSGKLKPFTVNGSQRKAFEWCEGVVYQELSAVDQPADPTALTQEVLDVRSRLAQLEESSETLANESKMLVLQSRLNKLERELRDISMSKAAQMNPLPPPKTDEEEIILSPVEDAIDEDDDIEEHKDQMQREEEQEGPYSAEEVGIMSENKKYPFAKKYSHLKAKATKKGSVQVFDDNGILFTVLANRVKDAKPEYILRSIASKGLSVTAKEFKALVHTAQGGVQDYADSDKVQNEEPEAIGAPVDQVGEDTMRDQEQGTADEGTATGVGEATDMRVDHEVRTGEEEENPAEESLEQALEEIDEAEEALEEELELREIELDEQEAQQGAPTPSPISAPGQTMVGEKEDEEEESAAPAGDSAKEKAEDYGEEMTEGEGVDSEGTDDKEAGCSDKEAAKKKAQNLLGPDSGSTDGRQTDLEDEVYPPSTEVDTMQDSDMRVDRPEVDVTDDVQEEAVDDHEEKLSASLEDEKMKLESKLKELYKNRHKKAMAQFKRDFAAKFIRAAKLSVRREALNLEPSIIKQAIGDMLMTPFQIGQDEVPPVDSQSCVAMVESAITPDVLHAFVDGLFERSASLMKMSDEALLQLEKDAKRLQVVEPAYDMENTAIPSHSADLKRQASSGNLVFAPGSDDSASVEGHTERRSGIRDALGGTAIARTAKNMNSVAS